MLKKYINNKRINKTVLISLFLGIMAVFLFVFASSVFADTNSLLWGGTEGEVGEKIGLSNEPIQIIIAKLIRYALGFLGIVVLLLIIYGGFVWMTSGGNEEKIAQAKKILTNAIIGLIIIMMSFAIATFILNKLHGSTSGGGPPGGGEENPPGGFGVIGACSVESVYPERSQTDVPRNTSIIVTFKEKINPNTIMDSSGKIIPDRVRIYISKQGDSCDWIDINEDGNFAWEYCDSSNITNVKAYTTDNKTFVFVPDNYLGSASEYIWHTVYMSSNILKAEDDEPIFKACRNDYLKWEFEVSNKIDLTPPQVKEKGIFPPPDNKADITGVTQPAVRAEGKIEVKNKPSFYKEASASITKGTSSPSANIVMDAHCSDSGTLKVAVLSSGLSASLSKDGTLLGSSDFNGQDVVFDNYFVLTVDGSYSAGNSWDVTVEAEVQADTLTVGNKVYTFVDSNPASNEIISNGTNTTTADNIEKALANHPQITVSVSGIEVTITAIDAGEDGNKIVLDASSIYNASANPSGAFTITAMSNGANKETKTTINARPDQPKNAVIQVDFNEAINPLTVSGKAEDVKDWIRVVDIATGDYLQGKFEVSNGYRTVGFISDNKCGTNACGEDIYCLPGNSNLRVELVAAKLINCGDDNCVSRSPYNNCVSHHCKNTELENYPLSIMPLTGIADAALNSLDGNRDEDADGPVDFYNENDLIATCKKGNQINICTVDNKSNKCDISSDCKYFDGVSVEALSDRITELQKKGDNYQWSFFIDDKILLEAPVIKSTKPIHKDSVKLTDPMEVQFDMLMMSSSLKTGRVTIFNGKDYVWHKAINLWSMAGGGVGYWITKEDMDGDGDGWPDKTKAFINHSMLADTMSYRAQVGSGVKNIYQNCYKPSKGPDGSAGTCNAEKVSKPSCCPDSNLDKIEPTGELGEDGNCK